MSRETEEMLGALDDVVVVVKRAIRRAQVTGAPTVARGLEQVAATVWQIQADYTLHPAGDTGRPSAAEPSDQHAE
jgi:hypothetical protein